MQEFYNYKFREEGLSPKTLRNYITQQRIRIAKQMLADTDMLIRDISSYIGIPDSNYFVKIFKKEVGLTPNAYRKKHTAQHTTGKPSKNPSLQ